jgi:hypothetical protein
MQHHLKTRKSLGFWIVHSDPEQLYDSVNGMESPSYGRTVVVISPLIPDRCSRVGRKS